jgi:hypothetical protein
MKFATETIFIKQKAVDLRDKSKGHNQLFHFPKAALIAVIRHKLLGKKNWMTANGINGVLNLTTCDLSKRIL